MSAQCQMAAGCTHPVTYIGEKGYVYCAEHVGRRQGVERCRKMRAWELALIKSGKPLPSYKPGRKPATDRRRLIEDDIVHEVGNFWVAHEGDGLYLVYESGAVASTRVATFHYSDDPDRAKARAIADADRRATEPRP